MQLNLSEMSPLPLREQIVRRIREMILSGDLPEHYQLPSIRGLAREQRVGVVTVQRAYEDLEREKMIFPRQGKGSAHDLQELAAIHTLRRQIGTLRKLALDLFLEFRRSRELLEATPIVRASWLGQTLTHFLRSWRT